MLRKFTIITLLFGALLTGCDSPSEDGAPLVNDTLVGKWEDSRGKNWEYFSDGTVLMSEKDKEVTLNGKWSRLDDGRVKVEFTMLGNSVGEVFTEETKGDDISVTDSKGHVSNLKRVK